MSNACIVPNDKKLKIYDDDDDDDDDDDEKK